MWQGWARVGNRGLIRGGVSALAALGVAVSLGVTPAPAEAADVPVAGDVSSFTVAVPWKPDAGTVFAGAGGFVRQSTDGKHWYWVRYADGSSTEVPVTSDIRIVQDRQLVGSDILATLDSSAGADPVLHLRAMGTGTTSDLRIPAGQRFDSLAGSTAVTMSGSATSGDLRIHLLRGGAPDTTDTQIVVPPTVTALTFRGGDDRGAVFAYRPPGMAAQLAYADATTGTFDLMGNAMNGGALPTVVLDQSRIGWFGSLSGSLASVSRDDPAGPRTTAAMPARPASTVRSAALVGDTLLVSDAPVVVPAPDTLSPWGVPVIGVPLSGGTPVTVLPRSTGRLRATGDGRALIEGGTDHDDWAVRVLAAGTDGTGVDAGTRVLPMDSVAPRIDGMTLDRGQLRYAAASTGFDASTVRNLYSRELGLADGEPSGPATSLGAVDPAAVPCAAGSTCLRLIGGSQQLSYLSTSGTHDKIGNTPVAGANSRLLDGWGPFVAYTSGTPARLYVRDYDSSASLPVDQPAAAATVRGGTVWRTTAKPGVLSGATIREWGYGPTRTVVTNARCVPTELQSAGRWLYWSCGPQGAAGAYDLTADRNVALPVGTARLGDGYLVRHIGDHLVLNDFHLGTTGADQRIADLASSPLSDDRGWHWTVDRFGGGVVWADAPSDGAVTLHMLRPAVPASPLENVGVTSYDLFPTKPVASWKVDYVRQSTQVRVATRTFGPTRDYYLTDNWDERTDAGTPVPNGLYLHKATALPADGVGPALTSQDSGPVEDGLPVPHDYDDDGCPDLFTRSAPNYDFVYRGTSEGAFGYVSWGAVKGWGTGSLLVPTGDLDRDGQNDLLVRNSTGELRRYPGRGPGAFPDSAVPSMVIGKGWQIYNSVVSPGDLNGDGVPDLVAGDAAGSLWRYDGTGTGVFRPRVQIGYGYQIYNKIIAAADLNGDGHGDVLARDTAGVLWRYDGTGKGTLRARVKIGGGWNIYRDIVGIGDLSQDGRSDLVARDTSGKLWRYAGTGTGIFAPRKAVPPAFGTDVATLA